MPVEAQIPRVVMREQALVDGVLEWDMRIVERLKKRRMNRWIGTRRK